MKAMTELLRANAQATIDRAVVTQERLLTHIVETQQSGIGEHLKARLVATYEASYQAAQDVIDSNIKILWQTKPEA